jgi:PAT family beta-lactamase induction signal transducer AmpG
MATTDQIGQKETAGAATPSEKAVYPSASNKSAGKLSPAVWVGTTNFAEGLPYMLVRIVSSAFFTDIGVKERYLGYLNFFAIPWTLKFLWSPLVDIFSAKKRWLTILQFIISILTMAIALIIFAIPAQGDPTRYLSFIAVIFAGMAFIAATNDIAIDGYYLEGLPDKGDQAAYSGYRVLAYRIAMIFARSGLVAVAALAGRLLGATNKYLPWFYAFATGASAMLLVSVFHAFKLPNFEAIHAKKSSLKETFGTFARAFYSYLQQPQIWLALIFIITYKIGDELLFSMVTPFLLRELAIDKIQFSWIAGIVGAIGTIIGAILGGWWIKRQGLKKAIWPLTIMMNFNMWAYIWLAKVKPNPATLSGISQIAFVHGYEQFAAGLGSAALTIYMMRTCKPDFKATHYAIGSAIMTIPSAIVGGFSGQIIEHIGYLNLFIIAFFATSPSMLLLFWIPFLQDEPAAKS